MNFSSTSTTDEVLEGIDLLGKRILVTGTSAGIGIETARALVAHGASVVGAVRDLSKAEKSAATIRGAAAAGGSYELIELDLGSIGTARDCVDRLIRDGRRFDVVINNAGIIAPPSRINEDGLDAQFAVNHLGHFVLTNGLVPLMNPGARVICLTSSGHRFSDVDLDDVNFEKTPYDAQLAYSRSKTAVIQFAVEFDRLHRDAGIRACAVHPGGIATELMRHMQEGEMTEVLASINALNEQGGLPPFFIKTVAQGAATSVWAAVVADTEVIGGRYCEDCQVADTNDGPGFIGVRSYAIDPEKARELWAASVAMTGAP